MTSLHKLAEQTASDASPAEEPEAIAVEGLDARTVALLVIALGVTVFLLQYMQASCLRRWRSACCCSTRSIRWSTRMERVRVPRWIGAAVALGLTFGTILGGAYALQDEAMTVINELPTGARRITALVDATPKAAPGRSTKWSRRPRSCEKTDTPNQRPASCGCRSKSRA